MLVRGSWAPDERKMAKSGLASLLPWDWRSLVFRGCYPCAVIRQSKRCVGRLDFSILCCHFQSGSFRSNYRRFSGGKPVRRQCASLNSGVLAETFPFSRLQGMLIGASRHALRSTQELMDIKSHQRQVQQGCPRLP